MKASYNWLKELCEFRLHAHGLAEQLGHVGLNVETFEPCGDDWSFDVEVTTNRPDCLCHLGLAREIAAITGSKAHRPAAALHESADARLEDQARVEVSAPDLCPHYTARVITGVTVAPSPAWLQDRLTVCGVRPINNIVDATNYVMLECGQPLHAFDLSLLGGARVIVRRARPGEVITTIDGEEHELTGEECVIADQSKPIALAGVMGGLESEINVGTTEVLLEAARFDRRSVRRTARRHGMASESSFRFERGIDPEITDWASRRVCQLISDLTGGAVLAGAANIRADETSTPEVALRFRRLALVLGLEVAPAGVRSIFEGLGLEVLDQTDEAITVRIPSWRGDLRREIDLIEEVARIHGYDKIGETTDMRVRATVPSPGEVARRRTRLLLTGAGFNEVMTQSLVAPSPLQKAQPWCDAEPAELRNPVTTERTHLRLTNMANLVMVKQFNQAHGTECVHLFELGRIYLPQAGQERPEEKLCLTMLSDHEKGLRVLKGVLGNLLDELGIEGHVEEEPRCAGPFRSGQALVLRLDGALLGCAGVLADGIAQEADLRNRPALMEIDFELLAQRARLARRCRPITPYPSTRRDLAIVVSEEVLWADIERCIRQNAADILQSIELFDVYRGEAIRGGHKSIAFSLTFRRDDSTITSVEAEDAREAILSALQSELGAELR